MEQKQKAHEVAEKQIHAYRNRLREMLAATETQVDTSLVRRLQDLALEVSAGVPPFQEGSGAEADVHELLADICKAMQAGSTRRVRHPAARKRLVSVAVAVVAALVRLPREVPSS